MANMSVGEAVPAAIGAGHVSRWGAALAPAGAGSATAAVHRRGGDSEGQCRGFPKQPV